jgi:ribose/xylose/arabinose/galactoside ABC-type transport system permease subunit
MKTELSTGSRMKRPKFLSKNMATEGTLVLIILVLFIALTFASENFLTANNLSNLVRQTAVNGIVALGMTFIIISGGIDLSVGSIVGVAGVTSALLMKGGTAISVAIIITLLLVVVFGILNGVMVYDFHIPPFIATLGTMTIVRGATMLICDAKMVAGLPKAFTGFSQAKFLGMPSLFLVWVVLIIIASFIMTKTIFGRNIYAIGSNIEVARLSGINIRKNIYGIYAVGALLSGIAGILMTSRLANGIPTGGQGYEMDAIAAAVVGGASLSGAEGTIIGTVLGAMIMAILRNGGNLLGIDSFVLQMLIGFLIVLAVMVDQVRKMKSK